MTFAMIKTTNQNICDCLNHWWNQNHQRPYVKDWMIRKMGTGTYLFDCNEAVLTLLLDLKARYNGDVIIYLVEPIHGNDFPVEVRKEVETCKNNNVYPIKERLMEMSKTRPRYSLTLREKSSE